MEEYIIKNGRIKIKSFTGNYYYTINELIDSFIKDDDNLIWFLSHYNLPEEIEDIIINAWHRTKLERKFKEIKIKENEVRLTNKIKFPVL